MILHLTRQQNQYYKQTIQRLEDRIPELEEFVQTITDGLRVPIRSITSFADLLLEERTQTEDDTPALYLKYIIKRLVV